MKNNLLPFILALLSFFVASHLSAADGLSVTGKSIGTDGNGTLNPERWTLDADKGTVTALHELPFTWSPGNGDETELVVGLSVTYEKRDGQLYLEVTHTEFQGFIEIAPKKFTPLINAAQAKLVLPTPDGEPVTVKLDGQEEIVFRWSENADPRRVDW
ncbi:hypothetical protein H5P28_08015 [Ruficoccus amylovorans]|uniref:Uncharacterized protein n=1 Tax=Ruficoccus amylovorans TaxID=1804625 RepID=A0A842HEY6_9BACT|nr:hypothetical protein [Ruficoccus amylovorans]MBC2594206.1 hypothetical protein [Ruficoccus amylovorans]